MKNIHPKFIHVLLRSLGILCLLFSVLSAKAQLPAASFYQLKRDEQLLSSFYHCLAEDEYGFIWFGSRFGGGLYRFDGYDLKTFVVDPSKLHISLSSNQINTVFSFGDRKLYVGTHGGMTVLNLVTGAMQCYADQIDKVPDYAAFLIEPIIPDLVRNCIWFGSAYGLCSIGWDNDSIICHLPGLDQPQMSMPKNIIDMIIDPLHENILWIGTANELHSYNKDSGKYSYHAIPDAPDLVIMDLFPDKEGNIWIGGYAGRDQHVGKLFRYTPRSGIFIQYALAIAGNDHTQDVDEVYNIMSSAEADQLWISTKSSVGILNIKSGVYEAWTYDPGHPDGLLPNEFFRSMLADRHGRLWISSWQGIQYAKDSFANLGKPDFKPRVCIIDVQISNARADMKKPLLYHEAVQLKVDQRDITFRYVLPNPLHPGDITYEYKLDGWEREWTSSDQRLVKYTRLSGGSYTFLVRGREGDDAWSEITSLPISIEYKLTELFWFWLLVVVFIGGAILATFRYMIFRAHKEEKLKIEFNKRVSEIEMQALRAQMNPHFLFNSINSIKYYALSKDKDATAEYLTKFALLVRTILNNSKSHTISVKEEIEALRLYIEIEHLRLEGKFEYHIDIDSSIRVERAQMPPMILQPFVENAIWHGLMHKNKGGKLLIQVRDLGTQIQCVIEDNGIGRAKSVEIQGNGTRHKKSMGMQITGDRISIINHIYGIDTRVHVIDLVNAKGEPEGTRVVINIPLIDENE